jgi:hypothetical protein
MWGVDGFSDYIPIGTSSSSTSTITIPVPHCLGTLRFVLRARDTSGNVNATSEVEVPVVDNDAPFLLEDLTPGTASTGRDLVLVLRAGDNIAIADVRAEVGFDGAPLSSMTMMSVAGQHTVTVHVPSDAHAMEYRFMLTDTSGNANATTALQVPVEDVIPPDVAGSADLSVRTGEPFVLETRGSDNRGTVTVTFHLRVPGFAWTADGRACGREYDLAVTSGELGITTERFSGAIEWYVDVTDEEGNIGRHGSVDAPFKVEVLDVTPPIVSLVGPRECVVGQQVLFDASASGDDVGIRSVVWRVDGPEGFVWTGERVTASFTRVGEYRIHLEVVDTSGNVATSDIVTEVMERPQYSTTDSLPILLLVVVAIGLVWLAVAMRHRRDRTP